MSKSNDTAASSAETIAILADNCRESFLCMWDVAKAAAAHEALDNFAESADPVAWPITLDAAIELAVYLCSFVESGSAPGKDAYEHIESLCARLEQAALEDLEAKAAPLKPGSAPVLAQVERSRPAKTPAKRSDTPLVLYIRSADRELPGLSAALAAGKLAVKPALTIAEASVALGKVTPDALLVDSQLLAAVGELVSRLETADRSIRALPSTLVLGADLDATARLAALRSGADLVISDTQSERIAAEVLQRVQERRESAFRVLIIEDDSSQAFYVDSILRHQGVVTRVATTADDGLDALGDFRPDLVLLDLHLADRNGIEIAQIIRQRPELDFVQIVFLSGDQRPEQRFDAIRLGADDFVTKPIKPRHLIALTESRARRARRLAASAVNQGADSRSGRISREQLLELIANAHAGLSRPSALVYVSLRRQPVAGRDAGFVALGRLQNEIASVIAEHPSVNQGVCCHEHLGYLLLVEGEDAPDIGLRISALHQTLSQHDWSADPFAHNVGFQIAALRISSQFATEDAVIAELIELRQSGKADSDHRLLRLDLPDQGDTDTPQARLIRKLFSGKLFRSNADARFQPLLPVQGDRVGLYRLNLRFGSNDNDPRLTVAVADCMAHARRLRSESLVVHALLHHGLMALTRRKQHSPSLGLLLAMPIETLRDELLLAWLSAELSRIEMDAGTLTLEFDAEDLRPGLVQWGETLNALRTLGFRIAAGPVASAELAGALAASTHIDMLSVDIAATGANESVTTAQLGSILKQARQHGKQTLVAGADRAEQIATLWSMNIDYLCGAAICGELTDTVFEFPE